MQKINLTVTSPRTSKVNNVYNIQTNKGSVQFSISQEYEEGKLQEESTVKLGLHDLTRLRDGLSYAIKNFEKA